MSPAREPLAVIGVGYVGLVTAAGFAEMDSEVWCVDIDEERIEALRRGEVPIYEPGLDDAVAACAERLHFTTDLAEALRNARLLFVAVGTPSTYSGDADLSAVYAVVDSLPVGSEHALVMKSTVPSGTGRAIKRRMASRGDADFAYVSCPEFLREGSALSDFRHPDRVVVGDERTWAGDAVVELYAPLGASLVRTDIASAEMAKLASNAFLATKISFINEIANVCEETGADVAEVSRAMGLDARIGPAFLQPGIGYGGSCLVGQETVLVRRRGRTTLLRLEDLWTRLEMESGPRGAEAVEPDDVEVLAWQPGHHAPEYLRVMTATRRRYEGDIIEVRTKMGRSVSCTPDHPWLVEDGRDGDWKVELAADLAAQHWLPLAQGTRGPLEPALLSSLVPAAEASGLEPHEVIVRPPGEQIDALVQLPIAERHEVFVTSRSAASRTGDVKRTGTLRLDELGRAGLPVGGCTLGTARNGNFVRSEITLDHAFWRVVGLYLAEGHCAVEGNRHRLVWSFHPRREQHLVDEVAAFWMRHGARCQVYARPTATVVTVPSRLLGAWWTNVLGLGRTSYLQRLPDLIWERCEGDKWALLSGLWEGDGSWSLVRGGPSAVLEWGTVSDELADGVLRLLGDVGIVAGHRVGRTRKSTCDTHWLRISGAEQVERAMRLVPARDRLGVETTLARQAKRIAPTGYRPCGPGPARVRIASTARRWFQGHVYSLEVPGAHTFVTTGGLITHNCFPKDVSALKQLAGNSGYHFQLLNAVIEVNELQKRRVVAKLHKHLGSLVGTTVALLGLAFKPDTDDMREASSLILAARLQSEGAHVRAYDPVAEGEASELMTGVELAGDALDAVAGADACVLVTEWEEFLKLDWTEVAGRMAGRLVVDGRNALDPSAVRAGGLEYEGIGRR